MQDTTLPRRKKPRWASFVQTRCRCRLPRLLGRMPFWCEAIPVEEAISELFRYGLELYSENDSLDGTQIVGQAVTLQIPLSNGSCQYVNGIVGRFTQAGIDNRFVTYLAELHPWLWMLTMSCRLSHLSEHDQPGYREADIFKFGFSDFSDKTTGTYASRDYCVQYRETAFAFVSRLLEEEGISYYFTHDDSKHTMVLVDDSSSWGTCPGLTAARYVGRGPGYNSDDISSTARRSRRSRPASSSRTITTSLFPPTSLLAAASGSDTRNSPSMIIQVCTRLRATAKPSSAVAWPLWKSLPRHFVDPPLPFVSCRRHIYFGQPLPV